MGNSNNSHNIEYLPVKSIPGLANLSAGNPYAGMAASVYGKRVAIPAYSQYISGQLHVKKDGSGNLVLVPATGGQAREQTLSPGQVVILRRAIQSYGGGPGPSGPSGPTWRGF